MAPICQRGFLRAASLTYTVCGAGRGDRGNRNKAFIDTARTELRAHLLEAARSGRLVYNDGPLVDVFVDGKAEATAEDLELLDVDESVQ